MNQLVSVIVPIYNVEKYLNRCLESINNQTYQNIEVILVDDGSTDASGIIADEYALTHKKFQVIHKENGGLSDARNKGLEHARGDYVCFIDSDDLIHKEYIYALYKAMIEHKCDIAECDFERVDERKLTELDLMNLEADYVADVYDNISMLKRLYNSTYIRTVVTWNKLYRKELLDGIAFPAGRIHEDEATTYKILYKANSVVVLSSKLYFYYQNSDSIMRKKYNMKRMDILLAIEERREFFRQKNLEELFFEDTHKYLMKILATYSQIKKLDGVDNKKEVLNELRKKYRRAYYECENAPWSFKRKVKLSVYKWFPDLYDLM